MVDKQNEAAPHRLASLPYPENSLDPHISSRTIGFHYGKHHSTYVSKTNDLVRGTALAALSLEDLIRQSCGDPKAVAVFNNAAQAWNHSFYWRSMRPKGGGEPGGQLRAKIEEDFSGLDNFRKEFSTAATTLFGSGWVWLVLNGGRLELASTSNADTPIAHGKEALLTLDVWEHAYYLDYQNRRVDYVAAYLDRLVNWDFAAENLALCKK